MNRLEREVLELIAAEGVERGFPTGCVRTGRDLWWEVRRKDGVVVQLWWNRIVLRDRRRYASHEYTGWWARRRLERACRRAQRESESKERELREAAIRQGGIDGLLDWAELLRGAA